MEENYYDLSVFWNIFHKHSGIDHCYFSRRPLFCGTVASAIAGQMGIFRTT